MYQDDFMDCLDIILTNTPVSMDAYKMFNNLNQTSKTSRARVKWAFENKLWTKEYFDRAHALEKMVEDDGITTENLSKIVENLKEFQPILLIQINVFKVLALFINQRASRPYPQLDELMSKSISRHKSIQAIDLHIAFCEILASDSRKFRVDDHYSIHNLNIENQKIHRGNINGLIDLMILHRKKSDIRLQISVSEMLTSQDIFTHDNSYRLRWIKFLIDQIANTNGIKALTSIKMLLHGCEIGGLNSNIRTELVSFNGIDIILNYMRKDFVVNNHLERKEENQQVGFKIFLELRKEPDSMIKMVDKIIQTTLFQETIFLGVMTNNHKEKFHLAQLKNNVYAYWMILNIIRTPFLLYQYFSAQQTEIILDLIERDFESTQALLYLFGILYRLLVDDETNFFSNIMLKKKNVDRIIRFYRLPRNYNLILDEVMQVVMYHLFAVCDDSKIRHEFWKFWKNNETFLSQDRICESKFRIFSFDEPDEVLSEDQNLQKLLNDRFSSFKKFYPSNDDSDEDSNDIDSNDTLSDEDSDNDAGSEISAFSDNIISSDSEDGAGHYFLRKGMDYDGDDQDSNLSSESSISDESEDGARSSCYADTSSSKNGEDSEEEVSDLDSE